MDIKKIKVGKTVTVNPPRGQSYSGKVTHIANREDGAWITVEVKIGTGKQATYTERKVRPGYIAD